MAKSYATESRLKTTTTTTTVAIVRAIEDYSLDVAVGLEQYSFSLIQAIHLASQFADSTAQINAELDSCTSQNSYDYYCSNYFNMDFHCYGRGFSRHSKPILEALIFVQLSYFKHFLLLSLWKA